MLRQYASRSTRNMFQPYRRGFADEGRVELILGPMFSGKTTELMRRIKRHTVAQRSCMLVKYAQDNRYSVEEAATHDKHTFPATPTESLYSIIDLALEFDCIGIDEGQFFPDLSVFCEDMANRGKTVIVAALDGTFQRKPFEDVMQLVPLAEDVSKLSAVCMSCHKDAAFSKRLGTEKEVQVIGGADKYIAVCRECYFLKETPVPSQKGDITQNRMELLNSPSRALPSK